jgi:diaminopimelate decarboxylase
MKVIAIRGQNKLKRAVVDASTCQLPDIRLQNRYYEIANASNPEGEPSPVLISGCGTDGGDCFTPAPREIADVRMGDVLAVRAAGAYIMGHAGVFNMRPCPAEIMLEDGRERLIRKRETIDDLLRNQNW